MTVTAMQPGKEVREGKHTEQKTNVSGILIPVEWDEQGHPEALAICTRDEKTYVIEPDTKARELLGFLRQEIEAEGLVSKGGRKQNTIKLENYWLK
jgi:hypothetical protein